VTDVIRLAILVAAVAAVVLVAAALQPEWAHDVGLDRVDLSWLPSVAGSRAEVLDRPDEEVRATQRRISAKNQVVEDLVAGRLTLDEATAAFRRINATSRPGGAPPQIGPETEDEASRQVMSWVRMRLGTGFRAGRETAGDFEDALRRYREHHAVFSSAGGADSGPASATEDVAE
jgi:hypothetical protein